MGKGAADLDAGRSSYNFFCSGFQNDQTNLQAQYLTKLG
jgi:hypothetical protein